MGHSLFRQLEALAEAGHRFVRRAPEPTKLVRQEGARETDIETPIAYRVEHADFAGELERVVEDGQHGTRHQAHAARALCCGGKEQHRVGAVTAVVMKIMLDDTDMGETEALRFLYEIERVAKVFGAGFLFGPYIRKKLHAKLHAVEDTLARLPVNLRSALRASIVKTAAQGVSAALDGRPGGVIRSPPKM